MTPAALRLVAIGRKNWQFYGSASGGNRSDDTQKTEAMLRCKIMNHFTKLGLPKFVFQ